MSDRYSQLVNAPRRLADRPPARPAPAGRSSTATAPARRSSPAPVLAGAAPGGRLGSALDGLPRPDQGRTGRRPRARSKALVFDATGIADSTELVELQRFFYPAVGRAASAAAASSSSARRRPRPARPAPHTAQRALEGFTRSLGKEIGGAASTVQLVYVAEGAEDQLDSTLRFLLSPRSAYVSGQVVRVGAGVAAGAGARLGAPAGRQAGARHRRLARDRRGDRRDPGPRRRRGRRARRARAADDLRAVADGVGGEAIELDITDADAPERIAERFADGVDVVVHNAGVTRDRTIAKMPEERWTQLMEINLSSEERINDALLDRGLLRRQRPHRLRLLDDGDRRQLRPDQLRRPRRPA